MLCGFVVAALFAPLAWAEELVVFPEAIELSAGSPQQQLVVLKQGERLQDLTRNGVVTVADPDIASIDAAGKVHGLASGTTQLRIVHGGLERTIPVVVNEIDAIQPVDFQRDVQPIMTRYGCNMGACHGKQRGQNGFQLSLLGFDSEFDFDALTKEARSRRVFVPVPERSLLLTKPTGELPHGGGRRIERESPAYETLRRWIASGAPRAVPGTPTLESVEVFPTARSLAAGESQQLVVTAIYDDGSKRDVTHLATYQSNEGPIAAVDEHGLVTAGRIVGEVAVMARYEGHFAISTISVPLAGETMPTGPAGDGFVDRLVREGLERLSLVASPPAPDHKFLRRAYIDIIGRLPTAEEARAFLDDDAADKRTRLIDTLLDDPEYAEHWANKWVDLLRPNPYRVGIKATFNYDGWIRQAFRKNLPYDEFVRQLVTAKGSTFREGNVTLFRDRRSPDEITTIVSQLFLGIRLECAKCHHHPFEVYGQDQFYSFAAYFAEVGHSGVGLSPPISGSEEYVFHADRGSVRHPLTNEVMEPRPLYGEAPEVEAGSDPREALAAWMTSPENPYFAQTMANRVWTDLMGRGLVEPVDDLRSTNPPSNAALLRALAEDFAAHDFDIKHLIRRIATSNAYALSSEPVERNVVDTRYFARRYRERLRAEVLLDAVCEITGVPESFAAMPPQTSAKELWTHRIGSLFLDAFGRPDPNQDPPCERTSDPTVVQTLHLMNSESLARKITSDKGRAREFAESDRTPEQIVEELYLSVYARRPTSEEASLAVGLFAEATDAGERRRQTEDLMWALLNTPEFVFKD